MVYLAFLLFGIKDDLHQVQYLVFRCVFLLQLELALKLLVLLPVGMKWKAS